MEEPKYSLSKTLKTRKKVRDMIIDLGLYGAEIASLGINKRRLCGVLSDLLLEDLTLPDYDIAPGDEHYHILTEEIDLFEKQRKKALGSVLDLFYEESLTDDVIKDIGIIISGNIDAFNKGQMFARWGGLADTWAPVYVLGVARIYSRRKKIYAVTFKSYGGVTAGMQWTSYLSSGYIQRMMREAGLSKYGKYPPENIGGMWMTLLISNTKTGISYIEITHSSSQQTHNKNLHKAREQKCKGPYKPYRGKHKCSVCPLGRDKCPLARVPKSFVVKECINKHKGYFNPDRECEFCMACLMANKTKRGFDNEKNT